MRIVDRLDDQRGELKEQVAEAVADIEEFEHFILLHTSLTSLLLEDISDAIRAGLGARDKSAILVPRRL